MRTNNVKFRFGEWNYVYNKIWTETKIKQETGYGYIDQQLFH